MGIFNKNKKRKEFQDTKFGQFLKRMTTKIPELAGDVLEIATSPNPIGAGILKIKDKLLQGAKTDQRYKTMLAELEAQELEFRQEVYEWEVKDRMNARKMYRSKSAMADRIAKSVMDKNLFYIAILLIANILSTIASYIYIQDKKLAVTVGTTVGTTIGAVIGSLLQERNQVVGFFFGSAHDYKKEINKND